MTRLLSLAPNPQDIKKLNRNNKRYPFQYRIYVTKSSPRCWKEWNGNQEGKKMTLHIFFKKIYYKLKSNK